MVTSGMARHAGAARTVPGDGGDQSGGTAAAAVTVSTIGAVMLDANIRGTRSVQERCKKVGLAGCNVIHCTTLPCYSMMNFITFIKRHYA
jgi:hypothetical protein